MRVLFLTNVPSPYRVDFFNELGQFCDLTVLFEKETSSERDASWRKYEFRNFIGIFLKGKSIKTDTAFCPEVVKYLKNPYDRIICTTFTDPTGMIAVQYMKNHKIPYYLEADGGFAKDGNGIKEKVKKLFIAGAKGYFSTGKSCDEYFITYGAERNKIIRYPFSSLLEADLLKEPIQQDEKKNIRRLLGIKEEKMVLTVGQFIYRKGFDILLKAVSELDGDIGVYFVGGGPTEEYLQLQHSYNLNNVHFVGFKSKNELKEYYKAADLFVLPTREDIWGLVIEEAMAYGLPIVSTNRCAAAEELVDDKNGRIVRTENPVELRRAMLEVLDSAQVFGINSLNRITQYTIEKMARKHVEELK